MGNHSQPRSTGTLHYRLSNQPQCVDCHDTQPTRVWSCAALPRVDTQSHAVALGEHGGAAACIWHWYGVGIFFVCVEVV